MGEIDQKSKLTSSLVDELSTRRRHYCELKQGLIGQIENNKIILNQSRLFHYLEYKQY